MSAALPENVHALRGTRPTRASDEKSSIAAGRPTMPKDLSEDERIAWKEAVKVLSSRHTLTKADGLALRLYAETSARHKALLREIKENGEMVDQPVLDSNGVCHKKRVLSQASKAASTLAARLHALLREFSLTPITRERTKPAAPPAPKKNEIKPGSMEDLDRQLAEIEAQEAAGTYVEED